MGEESVEMEVEFPKDELANHEGFSEGKDEESAGEEGENEEGSLVEEPERTEEDQRNDAEAFSCMLQPSFSGSDPCYVGVRRLLLYRKALSGRCRRKEWRCNGKAYVAYRNYIRRPKNWENMQMLSQNSTPGNSRRWASSSGLHNTLYEADSWSSSRELQGFNPAVSHCASFSSTFSESNHLIRFVEPAYSFVGMQCIFDSCKASVTVVKFGHMSSDLLAYGASDGSLTVCTVTQPPAILQLLKGHSKDITDFDFSLNNQYICSSSLDKTVRIWEISKGHCVRVIYGVSSQLCIHFHPVNNNFLSVGNSNREITVINFSTGRIISKITFESEITAMDNDHTGQHIFAGDNQGSVHSMSIDSHTGALSRSHRNRSISKNKSCITTVQYRTFSLLARGPVLLTCSQDGTISFFSVTLEIKGYLTLRCSLRIPPHTHGIHASFCPLLSLEKGEFIVSGNEDSSVYFYDLTKPKHTCVNKLQGHGAPVTGIAWNHGRKLASFI